MKIAIDGPAGAGKSTIARELAAKTKIAYLDTGAMYRAVTLKFLRLGTDIDDLAGTEQLLNSINIDFSFTDDVTRVFLDGAEVTDEIRSSEVNKMVSPVSALPAVRGKLVKMQQDLAEKWGSVVMDGRDIGTRVLPDAAYKFYLDASPEERARRRWQECRDKGRTDTLEEIKQEINNRDRIDSSRAESPLQAAEGAIIIDTTNMARQEVLQAVMNYMGP